jgi:parallel beta-helix repeat protein
VEAENMRKLSLLFACLLLAIPCSARIITVDDDGPADFNNIQAAINDANDGDIVEVLTGIYTGDDNRDIDYLGKVITVRSTDPNDPCMVAATVIDCNHSESGFSFNSGEEVNSILDGFTIINGYGLGGGIYCWGASPTITNCTISNGWGNGGGIYCSGGGSPTITNCTITGNTAQTGHGGGRGGGIYCLSGSPVITDCSIMYNTAKNDGGGIYSYDSSPRITNCTITGNTAQTGHGGGVYCYMSESTITNCIINDNNTINYGGGIYGEESTLTLFNCMFTGNIGEIGGGIYSYGSIVNTTNCTVTGNAARSVCGGAFGDTLSITNSILWGNTDASGTGESAQITYNVAPEVAYSCIQDDDPNDMNVPFSDGDNIDDDPLFVRNPNDGGDGWGIGDNDDFGDLHIQFYSPCINRGDPGIVVTKPEGGEVWVSDSIHEIQWSSYGVGNVDILWSADGGSGWLPIDYDVANTGSYTWDLPGIVGSSECLVSVVPSDSDPNVMCIESGFFLIHSDYPGSAVESEWKSLGGDFDRIGLSETYGPELGCVKWQFETDGPISASVTIGVDGRIHIPSEDGKVYTVDANGLLLWSYDTNSAILSSPTIRHDGTIYIGNQDGKLYAVDIDGNLRWTHSTEAFIYSSPAVSQDGQVYICSQDGSLYALCEDGSELWSFETGGFGAVSGSIFASPAIGADGTVYIAGLYDPNLYALDPNDGSVKWACSFIDPCDANSSAGWPFVSPVVAEDGTIYQTLLYNPRRLITEGEMELGFWYDSRLYAIDPNNGNILWSTNMTDTASSWFEPHYADISYGVWPYPYEWVGGGPPVTIRYYLVGNSSWSEPALGPDGTIYVSFDDAYLRAVDPNGSIKWVTRLGMMGGFTLNVGSDGLIYAASDDSHLYVVSPDSEELARFEGYDWLSFPVIAADNTIIVSDANNMVWAIGGNGCEGQPANPHRAEDLNFDWVVDLRDFALLAANWLGCTDKESYPSDAPVVCESPGDELYFTGDVDRSFYIDSNDLAMLVEQWLSEN